MKSFVIEGKNYIALCRCKQKLWKKQIVIGLEINRRRRLEDYRGEI